MARKMSINSDGELSLAEVREFVDRTLSESAFQSQVIALARACGWLVMHSRPARVQRRDGSFRYMTPIQGDAGFPDLVLARRGRVIFAELKRRSGQLKTGQKDWLEAIAPSDHPSPSHAVYVWRPGDWGEIVETLR